MSEIKVDPTSKRILTEQDLGWYKGYISTEVQVGKPEASWLTFKGPKVPAPLWQTIKSFLLWSNNEHSAEAQVRLMYDMGTNTWQAAVLPQVVVGLQTIELQGHPETESSLKEAGEQAVTGGTIHHHCQIPAFQSTTDDNDEALQTGLHITLGNMDKPAASIHARVTLRGVTYPAVLPEWLEGTEAEWVDLTTTVAFPEQWKTRIFTSTKGLKAYMPPKVHKGYSFKQDVSSRVYKSFSSLSTDPCGNVVMDADTFNPTRKQIGYTALRSALEEGCYASSLEVACSASMIAADASLAYRAVRALLDKAKNNNVMLAAISAIVQELQNFCDPSGSTKAIKAQDLAVVPQPIITHAAIQMLDILNSDDTGTVPVIKGFDGEPELEY